MRMILSLFLMLALAGPCLAGDFSLTSPDLADGGRMAETQLLNGFGCTGGNQSPALAWEHAPAGTKSFALTLYDPDAPTGSGWWHWVVFDLPAATRSLPAGAGTADGAKLPVGATQSRTDFGTPGYGGACPPVGHGPHRYIIKVYALDVERLGASPDSSAALVGFLLGQHTLATARLTGICTR